MEFIADLHIHSKFSRATSPLMNLENISDWAELKGITLVGTGDFTHPGWMAELKSKLQPDGSGLFRLRKNSPNRKIVPGSCKKEVRFILSAEVSLIYKKGGVCRKVHQLMYLPDMESVIKLNKELAKVGNIAYDGRPIIGLDSKRLLEMLLDISPEGMMIPAHAWTPHFAVFGSKSGFDSLEECFDDLAEHIFAIETGLSSDPPMNRLISRLDNIRLISNSDAHSLENLAREANLFRAELSYSGVMDAIRDGSGLVRTYEFFPDEGKYHYDGHRNCGCSMTPKQSRKLNNICPRCARELTLGVLHRVEELADRTIPAKAEWCSLIPLMEIIADVQGLVGTKGKRVKKEYFDLLEIFGDELRILTKTPISEIEESGYSQLARAIEKMRKGEVKIEPGYDGLYGKISLS